MTENFDLPTILWIGRYVIFFWSDESKPLEPIHIHVAFGRPSANSAKIWITSDGKAVLEHNKAMIPLKVMRRIIRVVEERSELIQEEWQEYFGEISYIR